MKITQIETYIASIPYCDQEISARVNRGGVTDVVVKIVTDDGLIGWGESCSGADVKSVECAVQSARPFLLGRSPWDHEQICRDFFMRGLWDYRPMTGNFAFAGIDMALWDICAKSVDQPLYQFFGGLARTSVNYFAYLKQGSLESVRKQCRQNMRRGCTVFYIKAGIDFFAEKEMIRVIRETIGETSKIRIDANGAWSVNEALRNLAELDECRLDFAEQPVAAEPVRNMAELRAHTAVALCANEGLGRISDVWEVIRARAADVLNFSSYWVGSLANFHRLAHAANWEGLRVCKHTHGEFGLAAAAHHQLLLTLPNIVDGHQETASTMEGDILTEDLPIIQSADWGVPAGTGLGVTVHEGRLQEAVERYNRDGQFLPHQTEISSAL